MRTFFLIGVLSLLLLPGDQAGACCMVPREFGGDVDQSEQQVVVLHHDGHQELIARVSPFFKGGNEGPAYIAWVLTVPSKPTAYAVADRGVFEQADALSEKLDDLATRQFERRSQFSSPLPEGMLGVDSAVTSNAAGGIDISATIHVGPYEITEVKARGAGALTELNRYLDQHGFPQEDPAHMQWFVENEFTFLCIYIRPPEGETKLGERLDLEPLQVGFDTPRPYYPGMFSSQQGNFALQLFTLTSKPLAKQPLRAVRNKLRGRRSQYVNLWTETALPAPLAESTSKAAPMANVDRWYVNSITSNGFNDPDRDTTIADWKQDVYFDLGTEADHPPEWYYGDRSISRMERFWREHKYAALLWTLVACLLLLWIRSRRRRATRAA